MAPKVPGFASAFHGPALAVRAVTTLNPTYTAPRLRDDRALAGLALHPVGRMEPASVSVTAPNTETMIVDPGSGEPPAFNETARCGCAVPR